ncbi:DnaD domain protein [Lactobacillus sp. LL6]|uniref:DnaD domain protein n=1 Tax=Lactobacillus sp. LL6 TaxID=2596827 RepID=UPI0011868C5D|nr:DnaD domain protein [Lactobacillus sp. LL6]TSO26598.1 chromosome replication initiation protein [Lactobacillus sp. LL6]
MFETSNPRQPFLVLNQIKLFPEDIEILIKLYQPLIGATAISLYQTLIEDFDSYDTISNAKAIGFLQQQIDCGLRDLFLALHKLEAVGLVKTYLKSTMVSQTILFRVLKVPQSREFFSTPLLSSLLREKIGPTNFQSLSHYFAVQNKSREKEIKDAQEVSASFFDVFRLSKSEAISPSQEVQEAAVENQIQDIPKAEVNDTDTVDWKFIEDQFETYQISVEEIKINQTAIRFLMQTYGLTEQEFVEEALPTLHGSYKLNMKAIEEMIADNYRLDHTRKNVIKQINKNKENAAPQKNNKNQKIIDVATNLSPAQFLYKMKEAKGGFTTASENKILSNLHIKGLPTDVINIIIYTCLEYYGNANVSYKLADNLANDWLQHNVATAAQALEYIEKRGINNRSQNKKRSFNKKHIEKGTDWSKKKAKQPDENFDPDELKKFFKNFEDENGMN